MISRRNLLRSVGILACIQSARAIGASRNSPVGDPIIGAIRWDAWYDPKAAIGRMVEANLGPKRFHLRMPFFGVELDERHVLIDGDNQSVFDREISYAQAIGLDYWAYCWYEDGSPFRKAWELHQKSAYGNLMRWCMLWQLSHLGGHQGFSASIPNFVCWMRQANYQKVADAPLVYLYLDSADVLHNQWGGDLSILESAIDELRCAVRKGGLHEPHIVILNSDPVKAATAMRRVRASAISNYIGWIPNGQPTPFSKLLLFNRIFWDKMAATGAPVVPVVMTGWDTRPRRLHPPPWERKAAQNTRPDENTYVAPGTNSEIDNAIHTAAEYVRSHPDICSSNLVLVYSWNECDEGGGALVSEEYLSESHHLR